MKWTTIATAVAAVPLASAAMFTKEQYRSGEVMSKMMEAKEVRYVSLYCLNSF
jgi:hypothetical protein